MPGGKRYPAGPLAYVAVGLFVMTWASIRLWRPSVIFDAPLATSLTRDEPATRSMPLAAPAKQAIVSIATNATPTTRPTAAKPAPPKSQAALVLEELATMPMVAEIAPPVATRIELDPVFTVEPEVSVDIDPPLAGPLSTELSAPLAVAPVAPMRQPERIARANVGRAPSPDRAWAYPTALTNALEKLTTSPTAGPWARDVITNVDRLFAADGLASIDADAALEELERLSNEAKTVATKVKTPHDRTWLSRSSYGLVRRLLIWRQIERLAGTQTVSTVDPAQLTKQIDRVQKYFATAPTWQQFLLLPELRAANNSPERRTELATKVLLRMESDALTDEQRAVITKQPVVDFTAALKFDVAGPINFAALLAALEQLELGHSSLAATEVASAWQMLRWSSDPQAVELADHVNTYYRNANARVAVSADLLNMLLPKQAATEEQIDDEILGARVFGRSQTSSRLRVVLLPDMRRLRLGLEAMGEVDSDAAATKGPATLYTQGVSRFHARKMLQVDRQGLRVWRSKAEVDTHSELTDVETDFDSLPIVNMFARAIARQQHDDHYYEATDEVRSKVAARAESRFDSEVHRQIAEAEREFMHQVYQPLERLQLEPTAVDLRTTREQLVARYRIAATHQLAAYTPRPAVSDTSVLNVQLHQSSLNNVLEQLKLDGRRVDLETLYREITRTFNRAIDQKMIDELPPKVTVQFAQRDAVRVHCDGGRLTLMIRLAELSQGRERKWKDFTVQAYYVPQHGTLDAKLAREGTIELIGERLNFRDQIALRGIFTKVLSKDRTFNLVQEKFARDPRLQSLKIDQFTVDDGWIGLSIARPQVDKRRVAGENRAQR
jgi:hypothetical protein